MASAQAALPDALTPALRAIFERRCQLLRDCGKQITDAGSERIEIGCGKVEIDGKKQFISNVSHLLNHATCPTPLFFPVGNDRRMRFFPQFGYSFAAHTGTSYDPRSEFESPMETFPIADKTAHLDPMRAAFTDNLEKKSHYTFRPFQRTTHADTYYIQPRNQEDVAYIATYVETINADITAGKLVFSDPTMVPARLPDDYNESIPLHDYHLIDRSIIADTPEDPTKIETVFLNIYVRKLAKSRQYLVFERYTNVPISLSAEHMKWFHNTFSSSRIIDTETETLRHHPTQETSRLYYRIFTLDNHELYFPLRFPYAFQGNDPTNPFLRGIVQLNFPDSHKNRKTMPLSVIPQEFIRKSSQNLYLDPTKDPGKKRNNNAMDDDDDDDDDDVGGPRAAATANPRGARPPLTRQAVAPPHNRNVQPRQNLPYVPRFAHAPQPPQVAPLLRPDMDVPHRANPPRNSHFPPTRQPPQGALFLQPAMDVSSPQDAASPEAQDDSYVGGPLPSLPLFSFETQPPQASRLTDDAANAPNSNDPDSPNTNPVQAGVHVFNPSLFDDPFQEYMDTHGLDG